MGIVENIKLLCVENNTSIPRVEKALGLSNGSVYNWNKSYPSIDKVIKVADLFDVSTDFLLGRAERGEAYKGREIMSTCRNKDTILSEEDIEIIRKTSQILSSESIKKLLNNIKE